MLLFIAKNMQLTNSKIRFLIAEKKFAGKCKTVFAENLSDG